MNTSKIIIGTVGGGKYTVTAPIMQEHYGIILKIEGAELPETYQVDFSNDEHHGTSVTMIGNVDGVLIPRQFIDTGKDVFAFLYWVGEDYGKTVYKFRIPNQYRPDRTNEQPTPEEQSVIDQAIAALNDAVDQTAQDVIDADASAQASAESARASGESALSASNSALSAGEYASNALDYAESASASATASAQSAEQAQASEQGCARAVQDAVEAAAISRARAEDSATSASQASGYAQSASASAQSASGYASQAQTSAQTASSKASEASTSASTASAKATESAQSASQALTYKTDAESAKTASQTAQGLAESARDSAISAKDDAEDARDEAQNIVDGISGKVEQIDSNTERIESLEDDRYKPYPTDTASGAVASFSDGADGIPLKSLIVDINPVQDTSSGDPSPTNICPISGWTEVGVEQSGKNIFDESAYTPTDMTFDRNGEIVTRNAIRLDIPTGTYTFRCNGETVEEYIYVYSFSADGTNLSNYILSTDVANGWRTKTITIDDGDYLILCKATARGTLPLTSIDLQIEVGSTATPYEPYTGRSLTIDLGQTVYGAKLYPLDGKAVIDRAMVDLGTLGFTFSAPANRAFVSIADVRQKTSWNTHIGLCSCYSEGNISNNSGDAVGFGFYSTTLFIRDPRFTSGITTAQIQSLLSGQMLVYELAEPIEIQLSTNQINSLYGVNNIWADTGDCSVEYRADTRLYIEKLTQPEEDDMIADSAISSGQFFMIGNSLYRALANIASGATITVGTNAQRISLADALNLINT